MTVNSTENKRVYSPKKQIIYNFLVLLIPLLFLLTFFILPIVILLLDGISGTSEGKIIDNFISILSNELTIHFIKFTGKQAFYSALITMIIGLPVGIIFSRIELPFNNLLKNLLTIPFVLPPIVVVLGFILLLGPQGLLNSILIDIFYFETAPISIYQSFEGILVVHTFYNIPIVMRLVSSAMERGDTELEDVASTLGSKRLNYFSNVIFPRIGSAWLASGVLTFLYCFTSFAIVISLGGIQFKTLEAYIYSIFYYSYDYQTASFLAILQLIITSIIIIFYLNLSEFGFQRNKNKKKTKLSNLLSKMFKLIIMLLGLIILIVKEFYRFSKNILQFPSFELIILYFTIKELRLQREWGDNTKYSYYRIFLKIFLYGLMEFFQIHYLLILGVLILLDYYNQYSIISSESLTSLQSKYKKNKLSVIYRQSKIKFFSIMVYLLSIIFFLLSPIALIFIYSFYDRFSNQWNPLAFLNLFGIKIEGNNLLFNLESIPELGASVFPIDLLLNSVIFALITVVFSSLLAILIVYGTRRSPFLAKHSFLMNIMSWLFLLPLATSSITIALGMLRFSSYTNIFTNQNWLMIIITHSLAAYPFITRSISTAYNNVPIELIEVAQSMGASPIAIFRYIEMPLILPGVISGAIFGLAISFGEFGATYFVARNQYMTLTIGVYKFLEVREFQYSSIMGSLLVLVCVISFLVINKLSNWEFKF